MQGTHGEDTGVAIGSNTDCAICASADSCLLRPMQIFMVPSIVNTRKAPEDGVVCLDCVYRHGRSGSTCATPSSPVPVRHGNTLPVSEESLLFLCQKETCTVRTLDHSKLQNARLLYHVATPPLWYSRQDPLQIVYPNLLLQRNESYHFNGLFQTLKHKPRCLCSSPLTQLSLDVFPKTLRYLDSRKDAN